MEIIIAHSHTKRRMKGNFDICGSKNDLIDFAEQVLSRASSDNFNYGWINIISEKQPALADTEPIGWD
jgi:hypothetical protein